MPIKIAVIYEESEYRPFPEWTTEEEDKRVYSGASFGLRGDAWATVFTTHLAFERHLLPRLSRRIGRLGQLLPSRTDPMADELWLRVCSPTFDESDARFRRGNQRRALIQDRFDYNDVEDYVRRKVTEVADRPLRQAFDTLGHYFHVDDPMN